MTDAPRLRAALLALGCLALAACEVPPGTAVFESAPAAPAPLPDAATVAPPAPASPIEAGPVTSPIEESAGGLQALNEPDLVLVRGYRDPNDPCQIAGESRLTRRYLSDSTDLVACLTGGGAAATLVSEKGARAVAQTQSYTLYQVPKG